LILTNRSEIAQLVPNVASQIDFAVWAIKIPKAKLAFTFEPVELRQKKWIVRKLDLSTPEATKDLRIGDKIVSINDVDLLDTWASNKDQLTWQPGQILRLGVVRNGKETTVEVNAIPNH
jgi:hypothetical protein